MSKGRDKYASLSSSEYRALARSHKKQNKYRSIPTEVDGHLFPSKAESRRYIELKLMQEAGVIRDLELQPRFPIRINGILVCTYVSDFRYWDVEQDREKIEDVKGKVTDVFRIKSKLMRAVHGIEVIEVTA